MINNLKNELQNILRGKNQVSYGEPIQAISCYLRGSKSTSTLAKTDKHFKQQEEEALIKYIQKHNLWIKDLNFDLYISEGAEQKVYLKDEDEVYKLNDSIYYATWVDYFDNLLLNNFFFTETAYNLKGFIENKNALYAQVEQKFIRANSNTNLENVKTFLNNNGFVNSRNNDYYNPTLGIILEDLHDENVLTSNGQLYFIDTVFYIKPEIFWSNQ